ncbi:ABC transporter ATP-binding protein [Aquabacter spiritensis]|uniref:Putative spermidine/putrescine transport system ATP-binding protein/spermidine/putrescine transport system ATP-binding protein n=1 Tax=Aquabacter spiritensis TaxID=933073 RepID=A0A4R3LP35_9HYPH|nr:ABC transporter ATP-binding protein [Aquabacter spiritensis]TCT02243.1 putative spermidine/putrescine transport system ATP-binding protein/spermidine/putrescine transport system ATP-binding protein [Aquabacter spiritensis]
MGEEKPILEVSGVTKAYGAALAVRGVDLAVRRGEFLTLLGPSGCGKTTLLRMIAGFETVTGGSIRIADRDATRLPPYRRNLGMVFQNLALFPHLTVGENVAFGLKVKRAPQSEIEQGVRRALELVELGHLKDRAVHQLSGGQRQRVALARALAIGPSLLLLDEPLGALDLKLRRQLQIELKQLQRRVGTTFIFVTHDQEEALGMSDRIAVMNQGRIEQLGTAKEIYDTPATAFVARFVGDNNLFEAQRNDGAGRAIRLPRLGIVRTAPRAMPEAQALLAVRPENIVLRRAPADGALSGDIVEDTYSGASVRYSIAVGTEHLVATMPCRVGEAPPFAKGDRVVIDWDDARSVLTPMDQT